MTDWKNTYLRGLSDRVRQIEDERKQVADQSVRRGGVASP